MKPLEIQISGKPSIGNYNSLHLDVLLYRTISPGEVIGAALKGR